MRLFLPLLFVCACLATALPGCEPKEDLLTTSTSAKLEFSRDTVTFDTVFAQVGTVTKRLWVYNRNARAVKVEQISLAAPEFYSLIIDGNEGPAVSNIEIRGKDSLQVLVRAKLGPGQQTDDKPFFVEDQILFRTNGNDQDVKLVAYGRNAYFHTRQVLPCGEVWRNDKPHVIYGAVLVPPGCTLTIEPGARVYSHAGAAIIVKGTLLVNAKFAPSQVLKADDRGIVRFAGDRLEPFYNDIPGQWAGIQFDSTSHDNVVRYAEIKDASFGLLLYNPGNQQPRPKVTVENTVIKNISASGLSFSNSQSFDGAGILSISGEADVRNTLFTNCGEYAILGVGGGKFDLNFCTIANYTPQFSRRETNSLSFSNKAARARPSNPIQTSISIQNSIVWGSIEDELAFEVVGMPYPILIQNSLLRTKAYKANFGLNDNLLNVNPKFKRAPDAPKFYVDKFDYQLDTLSPASNRPPRGPFLPRDLRNLPRDAARPDLGAYERVNP